MTYAGDVTVEECWESLQQDASAQLVDVRTVPEWSFVGVPRLDGIDKEPVFVEWQQYPSMEINPGFVQQVEARLDGAGADKTSHVYLLCRSGVRSISAAKAMTQAGYTNAFNILGGFEGDKDAAGHRASLAGWKFSQLPWSQ